MKQKQIRKRLTGSLAAAVKKLGVLKSGKKIEKLVERATAKLSQRIAEAIKKSKKKTARKAPAKKKATKTTRAYKKKGAATSAN